MATPVLQNQDQLESTLALLISQLNIQTATGEPQNIETKQEKEFSLLRFVGDSIDISQAAKSTINGYIRKAQEYFNWRKNSFYTIPPEINYLCLLYIRDSCSKVISDIYCDENIQTQIGSVRMLRRLLSTIENDKEISKLRETIDTKVISKMISFMYLLSDDELKLNLQSDAAWVLTDIATEPYRPLQIVDNGGIEAFVHVFQNATTPRITDQILWALGEMSAHSIVFKERILQTGFLNDIANKLLHLSQKGIQFGIWTIATLFRNRGPVQVSDIDELAQLLCKVSCDTNADDIIINCMWALHYISENTGPGIIDHLVLQTGIIDECVRLLKRETCKYEIELNKENKTQQQALLRTNPHICSPCLKIIGNVLSEPGELAQTVLDAGYLDVIEPWTNHPASELKREIMWSFSNILAGSHQQIELFLSRDVLLRAIMSAGMSGGEEVKREACWCICNVMAEGRISHKKKLVEHGAIEVLVELLKSENIRSDDVEFITEGIEAILSIDDGTKATNYAERFKELGALSHLERINEDEELSQGLDAMIFDLMGDH